ncbi:inx-7, partial [Pristionchus pacificus]
FQMFAFRVLHTVPYSNEPAANDVIAKLHSFITANVLIGAALVISFRQFGGKPIDCMVPTDFTPSWTQYAETYCFSQETYWVPFTSVVAGLTSADKAEKKVSYYQWMPFFLLFEAACFKVPCLIWKYFASQSGMRIGEILRLSSSDTNGVPEVKKSNVEALGVHLNGALRFHKILNHRRLIPHKILRFLNVKYSTYYVTLIYFIAKIAFLLNIGVQIKMLEKYVLPHSDEEHLAIKTWNMLVQGNETWKENGMFPRVTLCDFETRDMGNVQTHTIQCLLLMNVFTEKIFLILWTWFMTLAAITALNIVSWSWSMMSETSQLHFIVSHLDMSDVTIDKNKMDQAEKVTRFLNLYLGSDGMLVLFLVSQHSDVVFTSELVAHLWKSFTDVEQQRIALKKMNKFVELQQKIASSSNQDANDAAIEMTPRMKRAMSLEKIENGESRKRFDDSSSDESKTSNVSKRKKSKNDSEVNSRNHTPRPSQVGFF